MPVDGKLFFLLLQGATEISVKVKSDVTAFTEATSGMKMTHSFLVGCFKKS